MGNQRLALRGRHSINRRQQALTLERARRQPLHDLLEQHPLVRDVLIDDAMPSSSIAMMKVSRNCPSGIMGLIDEGSTEFCGTVSPAGSTRF